MSDNGSNFVAAERELREAAESFAEGKAVAATMADQKIVWRFKPPRSPRFGGVFEIVSRSLERIMQRILHRTDLTD